MNTTHAPKPLEWPLILILGALALVRPATRVVATQAGVAIGPAVPIGVTAGITIIWVAAVVLRRVERPLATLVLTALTYGVLSIAMSGILSPILDGHLAGPLARPVTIIPALAVNAVWGLISGALAVAVLRIRGTGRQAEQ